MWKKFDNFMQNWYMSMSWPLRDCVMGALAFALGALLIVGYFLYLALPI